MFETLFDFQLKGFEAIRAVHLETEQFAIENELITPTFKKRRPQLLKYYQVTFSVQQWPLLWIRLSVYT